MTTFGLIPFPLRAAFQLLLGLGLMAAPFVVGAEAAGTLVCVVVGALTTGLAFGSTVTERGTTPLPLHAIHAFDRGLALGALGAAIVLGVSGYGTGATVLIAFGLAQLLLGITTRYSLRA
jgi:hypothetical protein